MGDADGGQVVFGLDLRYLLTTLLVDAGQVLTVGDLVELVQAQGFFVAGRPSKTVSDALRWEVGRGRVLRHGRGLYGPGSMPRQTKSRIRKRVAALRQRLVAPRRDIERQAVLARVADNPTNRHNDVR